MRRSIINGYMMFADLDLDDNGRIRMVLMVFVVAVDDAKVRGLSAKFAV